MCWLESSKIQVYVYPSISLGFSDQLLLSTATTDTCGTAITPACIKAMYNISTGTLKNSKNTLGIFEFGDIYAQADLNSFYKTYASFVYPQIRLLRRLHNH